MDVKDFNLIRDIMQLSVTEVVETMTTLDVNTGGNYLSTLDNTDVNIVEAITFRNGINFNGVFLIKIEKSTAFEFTKRILRNIPDISEYDVLDAIGEILNIIVGKFKAILTSHNYELFDFSPPIRTLDSSTYGQLVINRRKKILLPFDTAEGAFALEIFFD